MYDFWSLVDNLYSLTFSRKHFCWIRTPQTHQRFWKMWIVHHFCLFSSSFSSMQCSHHRPFVWISLVWTLCSLKTFLVPHSCNWQNPNVFILDYWKLFIFKIKKEKQFAMQEVWVTTWNASRVFSIIQSIVSDSQVHRIGLHSLA